MSGPNVAPSAAGGPVDPEAVNFHVGDSRESSRVGAGPYPALAPSDDRTVGHALDTHPPAGLEAQAAASRPLGSNGAASRASGPSSIAQTSAPGYANDNIYGTAHNRAKVNNGASGGYYDEKEGKYHEDLPAASFGERLGGGIMRPTNLTAGERPHKGVASNGENDWERNSYERVAALPPGGAGWWPYFASLPAMYYPWNVNAQAYRLGMIPVIVLCLLGIDKRHHLWMHYVTLGLCVDFFVRFLAGPKASLCTLFGDCLDALFSLCRSSSAPRGLFPKSMVAGAPYQFSDFCYTLLLMAATICFFDSNDDDGDIAGAVLLAVTAGIAFLEFAFGFPLYVWTFNQCVHFGWIWKDSEIKSAMIRDEHQRLATTEELRSNAALAQIRDKKHAENPQHRHFASSSKDLTNGASQRTLPYTYRSANEYHKRHDLNPVKNIKMSYFLASASLAALAWVWALASSPAVFDTPDIVWQILIIAALVVFSVHFLLYIAKVALWPRHVMYEWEHPVYRSLFLAFPLAWLLFIPCIVQAGHSDLAEVVFWMGAPLLLAISIYQLALHYHQNMFFESFSAVWLMIPMSNAVAAYMLTIVHSSYSEVAWLWLGIAVFLWVILCTLLLLKGAFQPRQADVHRYSLWMIMGTAFAICIALVGIYAQTTGSVVAYSSGTPSLTTTTVEASGTPVSTLSLGSDYTVLVDSAQTNPTVYLPVLGAAATVSRVGLYSAEGTTRNYLVSPLGAQVINNGTGAFTVLPTQGGLECTDNSVSGSVVTGWTCTVRDPSSGSSTALLYSAAPWSTLGVATFYIGLVFFLMLLLLTLFGFFGRSEWNPRWWVVSLCFCLMSLATLLYHARWHSATSEGIATVALVLTNIVVGVMFLNHLRALVWGQLYRPDHLMLSPLEFFRLPSKALREVLALMAAHVNNPKASAADWTHFEGVLLPRYQLTVSALGYAKRGALYPVVGAWFGRQIFAPLDANARALEVALEGIVASMAHAQTLPVNSDARDLADKKNRADFATYVSGANANMDEEEVHLFSLARRYIGLKEANAMVRKSWDEVPPSRWAVIIPFIVDFLYSDLVRARWIECIAHAAPEHLPLVGKFLYENLDPFVWDRLIIDLPELRPRLTPGYSRVW